MNHNNTTPAHCSSCGSTDYEDLHCGDQGYSACCNKGICHGGPEERFGTQKINFSACCWGIAYEKFEAAGVEIPVGACNVTRTFGR